LERKKIIFEVKYELGMRKMLCSSGEIAVGQNLKKNCGKIAEIAKNCKKKIAKNAVLGKGHCGQNLVKSVSLTIVREKGTKRSTSPSRVKQRQRKMISHISDEFSQILI
jgi:hypothetical protein